MKHKDAIYSREETSPDGSLHVCYNYSDGEKCPQSVEPCVTVAATGEILLDLWRTGWNGHIENFDPEGFQLRIADRYGVKQVLVHVGVRSKTFTLPGNAPQPLSALREAVFPILASTGEPTTALHSPRQGFISIISKLTQLFR